MVVLMGCITEQDVLEESRLEVWGNAQSGMKAGMKI